MNNVLFNTDTHNTSIYLANWPNQSCSVSKETIDALVQIFFQKYQYYYTFSDQSVPLVAVRSNVFLLTEQLWAQLAKAFRIFWEKSLTLCPQSVDWRWYTVGAAERKWTVMIYHHHFLVHILKSIGKEKEKASKIC